MCGACIYTYYSIVVRAVCQNLWGLKGDAKAEGTQGTRCARGLSMVQPWEFECPGNEEWLSRIKKYWWWYDDEGWLWMVENHQADEGADEEVYGYDMYSVLESSFHRFFTSYDAAKRWVHVIIMWSQVALIFGPEVTVPGVLYARKIQMTMRV